MKKLPLFHLGKLNDKRHIFSFNGNILSIVGSSLIIYRENIKKFHLFFLFIVKIELNSGDQIKFFLKPIFSYNFKKKIFKFLNPHLILIHWITLFLFLLDVLISFWMVQFTGIIFPFIFSFIHSSIVYLILLGYLEKKTVGIYIILILHLILILILAWFLPHTRILNTMAFILILVFSGFFYIMRKGSWVILFISAVTISILHIQIFNFSAKKYLENQMYPSSISIDYSTRKTISYNGVTWKSPIYWKFEDYNILSISKYHTLTVSHILPFKPLGFFVNDNKDDKPMVAIIFPHPHIYSIKSHIKSYLRNLNRILWPHQLKECSLWNLTEKNILKNNSERKINILSCPFLNTYLRRIEYVHFLYSSDYHLVFSFYTLNKNISVDTLYPFLSGYELVIDKEDLERKN